MGNRANRRRKTAPNGAATSVKKTFAQNWSSFWDSKSPVLVFLLRFLGVIIPFYALWNTAFFKTYVLENWNAFNASVASVILNVFGSGTTANGTSLMGPVESIQIFEGCDAIEPTMIFVAGVIAFSAAFRVKLKGILIGSLILLSVNLLRIVALYLIKVHWDAAFDFMHHQFFQVFFIAAAILLWVLWIRKSSPSQTKA